MPKHFFVWRTGSKGPTMAIYHDEPPSKSAINSTLGPRVLKIQDIPDEMEEAIDRGETPFKRLSEMFPPPADQ